MSRRANASHPAESKPRRLAESDDATTPALYQTGTSHHNQILAQRVSVPRGGGARLERDTGTDCTCRSVRLEQGIDAYIAGEILDRAFGGRLRPASSDLQVLLRLLSSLRRSQSDNERRLAAFACTRH